MRRLLNVILVMIGLALIPAGPTLAQEAVQVLNRDWQAEFRDHITFTLEAESQAEIVEVDLLYRVVGQIATSRNEADFTPGEHIQADYVIDQTEPERYLPPGTELQYWWKITDAAGNELKTETETLLYLDTRYEWQTLEGERLTLYWVDGDQEFGQALFDRANEALDTLEMDMGVEVERPIKIFIYPTHEDLLGAISTVAQEWTGGQAFADYGVVVLAIDVCPEREFSQLVCRSQLPWGLDATTHEISHLVIHQATDNPYGDIPVWLDEGIAVYNEDQEQLDEDFRDSFERAVENNELLTLRSLSSPFPADPARANLSYGQSGAVVKFIIAEYGREDMAELLDIFSEGTLYDEALQEALGVDTDGLDNAFRAEYGLPPLPGTEPVEAVPTAESAAGAEPVPTESAPEEQSAPAPTEQPQSRSPALPCLGGLLPLGLALFRSRREA